ncbi:alpha/beta-hydrolase [Cadophora sp. DSE1049]|nr:alpha/beta-hydrolase [Cadophora sp. DSE1049]
MKFSFLLALVLPLTIVSGATQSPFTVKTLTGVFTGLQNPEYPAVREFRNIPYAQPPVNSLRFLPPQPLRPSVKHHYSTRFPPSCPQFSSSSASFWNLFASPLLVNNGNQNQSSGLSVQTASEDCLSLAIWTPYNVSADAKLPVAFFMTGGGFSTGGIDITGQRPQSWVNRTQGHIVVTTNYRVNIFGFPNAAASDSPNLGILDQRIALEWVYANIASFGGDPDSIMLWGQSAGSQSADYHNFAFWDNPIARSSFSQSGTASKQLSSADFTHSNFTFVAKSLGCDFPEEPFAELECMQQVPMTEIENFVGNYKGSPSIKFGPIADEVVIFSNYSARAANGKISPNPAIFSDTANNDATLKPWPINNTTDGPYQPVITAGTLSGWVCQTANTSIYRAAANRTTYRYQYAGNFSNPYSWLGAYHSSDLWMVFGTYDLYGTKNASAPAEAEVATSKAMQDYILAFMKDPINGPSAVGWLPYTYGSNVLRFGAGGVLVQNVSGYEIDGPCFDNGTYDPFP